MGIYNALSGACHVARIAAENERAAHAAWIAANPNESLSLADNRRYAGRGVLLLSDGNGDRGGQRGTVISARRPDPELRFDWTWVRTQTELTVRLLGVAVPYVCGLEHVKFTD